MYATEATLYYTALNNRLSLTPPPHDNEGVTFKFEVDLGRGLNLITVVNSNVAITTYTSQGDAFKAGFEAHQAGGAYIMIPCLA